MKSKNITISEEIQQMIVRMLATNPAGRNLFLIGGFRYRFLDGSVRRSMDIDYHWEENLVEKQEEIISLFKRKLLPNVKRRFNLDGDIFPGRRIEDQSDQVKIVELVFYRIGSQFARIEISVDITVADSLDPPEVRTAEGVIYPTLSDADLIENKVIAIMNRIFIQARDMLDIFLFQSSFLPESPRRIKEKLVHRFIKMESAKQRLEKIGDNRVIYVNALKKIIEEQVESPAAENLRSAGGAPFVFDQVLKILKRLVID
jgi:predicted nucleotidyltransferase component of viral defense system